MTRESYARPIGYGAMCLESLVAIMAIIAACTLDPGVYLGMNIKGAPAATVTQVNALGFPVTVDQMNQIAMKSAKKHFSGGQAARRRSPSAWHRFFPEPSMVDGWTFGITSPSCSRRYLS